MSKVMTLPKIGVNMTEAIIGKWLIKKGDTIQDGDEIIEAETDKATQSIYATTSGVIAELLVEEGDTVQVHQDIIVLVEDGEEACSSEQSKPIAQATEEETKAPEEAAVTYFAKAETVTPVRGADRVRISPLAKKMAKDKNIDLSDLKPAVAEKRIVKKDVLEYLEQNKNQPESGDAAEIIPMSPTRKIIAERMSQSNLEKPCAALTLSVNMDQMVQLREMYKRKGIRVSYDSIIVRVVANTIKKNMLINSVLEGDNIVVKKDVNIGVAIDGEKGLVVPVIKQASEMDVTQISEKLQAYVSQVKSNCLDVGDLCGGTFTVTNLGMFDIEQFTPVINPPECCILAVGAIKRKFVPDVNDNPVVVNEMKMTLVFDHRIVDGAPAARFLSEIKQTMEMPGMLL